MLQYLDFAFTNDFKGPFETMTDLFYDLGIQSNILNSARYSQELQGIDTNKSFRGVERCH